MNRLNAMNRLTSTGPAVGAGTEMVPNRGHELSPMRFGVTVRARNALATALVVAMAALIWLPRRGGPIDMRTDGAVYYILGTSLAEGKGYKLLNEPGDIDAVQYPPLLPAVVAVHQRALGTSDPTIVGRALRVTSFLLFLVYAAITLWFLNGFLSTGLTILGTMLSLFSLSVVFFSDTLFSDVWFSVATLLFVILVRRQGIVGSGLAYLAALASYTLRTIGVTAFAVWVLQSLVRRRYREAAVRAMLTLIPFAGWQLYVASVERSAAYVHPAYEYQRAPYLFYNVTYARNIALRDPLIPEKGQARIARRVARNVLLGVPVSLGETLTAPRRFFETVLSEMLGNGPIVRTLIVWGTFVALSVAGAVLVAGGAGTLLLAGEWIVPLYLALYFVAMCLTPFPGQYLRYLMPVTPLVALCGIVLLRALGARWPFLLLGPALLIQALVVASVYRREYLPVSYVDAAGRRTSYTLLFYYQRGFDEAVDYLRTHAEPTSIVAAGMPHWVYLRTGLKAVMPPLEQNVATAERLLEDVPVNYLIVGNDEFGRYTVPVVGAFADRWQPAYAAPAGGWTVYRRVDKPAAMRHPPGS